MNYQYRYGTSTREALRTLYGQGGFGRFYQGVGWALLQTPLSRFGDAAANSGVLELLSMTGLPMSVRTACAGLAASLWRVAITPLDTLKTTLQVEGPAAYALLVKKVSTHGVGSLYAGALATLAASFVGSYPWFVTFNYLDQMLPPAPAAVRSLKMCRSAALGVGAACVSDTISNSLRVVKTTRQTSAESMTYMKAAQLVLAADGWAGLLARGLGTRLITNALQSALFSVIWKLVEERIATRQLRDAKQSSAARVDAGSGADADSADDGQSGGAAAHAEGGVTADGALDASASREGEVDAECK